MQLGVIHSLFVLFGAKQSRELIEADAASFAVEGVTSPDVLLGLFGAIKLDDEDVEVTAAHAAHTVEVGGLFRPAKESICGC